MAVGESDGGGSAGAEGVAEEVGAAGGIPTAGGGGEDEHGVGCGFAEFGAGDAGVEGVAAMVFGLSLGIGGAEEEAAVVAGVLEDSVTPIGGGGQEVVGIVGVQVQGEGDLLDSVEALNVRGAMLGLGQGRKDEGGNQGDDGDQEEHDTGENRSGDGGSFTLQLLGVPVDLNPGDDATYQSGNGGNDQETEDAEDEGDDGELAGPAQVRARNRFGRGEIGGVHERKRFGVRKCVRAMRRIWASRLE